MVKKFPDPDPAGDLRNLRPWAGAGHGPDGHAADVGAPGWAGHGWAERSPQEWRAGDRAPGNRPASQVCVPVHNQFLFGYVPRS